MDLETLLINNIYIPYLLCGYDGNKSYSYLANSIKSSEIEDKILDMVNRAMKDICIRKYKVYTIYLYNFSKFEGYFLIKYLAQLGICNPIIHLVLFLLNLLNLIQNIQLFLWIVI